MKKIDRRQFLKGSAAAAGALSLPAFWLPRSARAATGPKKLVLFFLSGGNDGQNTIVPHRTFNDVLTEVTDATDPIGDPSSAQTQYDYYRELRPTLHLKKVAGDPLDQLLPLGPVPGSTTRHRIAMPSSFGAVPSGSCEFAMHPAMTGLRDIWDAGDLAIFPATHCGPEANRSHFFQTEYFGHGLNTVNTDQQGDGKGWVGRYFEQKYGSDPQRIEGFDFESGYHPLMDGDIPVLGMSNPEYVDLGSDGDDIRDKILQINAARAASGSPLYQKYADIQQALFDKIAKLESVEFDWPDGGDPNPYEYAPGKETSTARRFRQAAAMIKDSTGVGEEIEIINIDRGSFDTHSNQIIPDTATDPDAGNPAKGSHANTLGDVSDSLKAFYDDLNAAGLGDQVITVVQTEFGRTADENNNFGTDHARASCWFVMGGKNSGGSNKSINGGLYGEWPGIATNFDTGDTDLDGSSRKYLHQDVDYRDILSEIIGDFLDNSVNESSPFNPGSSSEYVRTDPPLGFIDITT